MKGDLIYGLDGKEVSSVDDIHKILGAIQPGKRVELLIVQAGKQKTLSIEPVEDRVR
jgi:S1-C subfamily serine protease